MGLLGKIGKAIQKIDENISDDPEIVGKRFEDHVGVLVLKTILQIDRENSQLGYQYESIC